MKRLSDGVNYLKKKLDFYRTDSLETGPKRGTTPGGGKETTSISPNAGEEGKGKKSPVNLI